MKTKSESEHGQRRKKPTKIVKKFLIDRVALTFTAAGIVLMALTLLWRINPVEGSVVPRFLTNNPAGMAVFWLLFITCIPVWIASHSQLLWDALTSGG